MLYESIWNINGSSETMFLEPKYEKKWMTWDIKRIVSNFIGDEQFVAEGISGRLAIASSELVIIDYQSTAHLESILMDKPTVFFWDEEVYPLDTRYQGFYQKLDLLWCGYAFNIPP